MSKHSRWPVPTKETFDIQVEGWKPTAYLRFVWVLGHRHLQQLWINSDGREKWRDVPFVE